MIKEAISILSKKQDLTYDMAQEAMEQIMLGNTKPAQLAGFLTALHIKGETVQEITAFAKTIRKHGQKFDYDMDLIDIVGTGGDGAGTINISTLASIIVSAAGVKVAKHGNRAASSKCGAADLLETLGVNIMPDIQTSKDLLDEINMCFLFAPKYHSALKNAAEVRKDIAIPTVFNILGPLVNPASANMHMMGVYDESLVEPMAQVLSRLSQKRAMVVYGRDKLDEISMCAETYVCEFREGKFWTYTITPEQYGFARCTPKDLQGGNPQENAKISMDILKGQKGPKTDAVILNAAAALHIAKDISIEDAIKLARQTLQSGKALSQLEKLIKKSNERSQLAR